jgi:hypothetical protein
MTTAQPTLNGWYAMVPSGTVAGYIHWGLGQAPSWLIVCDGQEFDPNQYPELKTALADRFGVNRVPDLSAYGAPPVLTEYLPQ